MNRGVQRRRRARTLFREGDRVRSMTTGRTGYVRDRRVSPRLGERYVVDWDGGLDFSLVPPIELELIWPVGRGGAGDVTRWEPDPAAD